MRIFILVLAAGCAVGQQRLNPIGNQGNILHPGIPASGSPRVRPRSGSIPFQGRTVYIPYAVPFDSFYSGYTGGYGYGGYGPAPGTYDPGYGGSPYAAGQTPTVIINQNFQPDTVHPMMYDLSNAPPPPNVVQLAPGQTGAAPSGQTSAPPAGLRDDQPTIFLIAMKDHTIYPVIAYWVDKDMLNYVTVESSVKRVPLDQVDRDMSRQLNDERQVEFKLPAR